MPLEQLIENVERAQRPRRTGEEQDRALIPLYPSVVRTISEVLAHDFDEKDDDKPFFTFNSFEKWLERQKIPLPRVRDPNKAHMWLSDFRKFAEQFGYIIGWDATNRKYGLAHGMTGMN